MPEKIVSQLDANGYFLAPVLADLSPLEEGVYLLPGGAIDVPPPDVPQGKVALRQGDTWVFVDPPEGDDELPPVNGVPQEVSMRQARRALLAAGLIDQVEAAIDALTSPAKEAARIDWEYAQVVRRGDPLVQMLAPALGLAEIDLDNLFTTAAGL